MRLRSVVAALAVFAVPFATFNGPGFGQPFSHVKGPHWAGEAIAKLAADDVIQGYPDGTFEDDRAMTRDEMAVVVVRLLARLEKDGTAVGQVQVQAPPPEVTREDIDLMQSLIDELRRELTDKGVRLPPVEETLNALKAKVSNVKIFGATEFRYDVSHAASGAPLNGNPLTGTTSAGASPGGNLPREVFRLGFDGSVTDNLHFIAVLITSGLVGSGTGFIPFNSTDFGFTTGNHLLATIDDAFLDWKLPLGLEVWFGRFGGAPPGTNYPVQFGPFGLLMNTAGDTWEDATLSSPSGEDAYGGDLNIQIGGGLRLGVNYVANTIAQSGSSPFSQPEGAVSFLYHVYGPGGGAVNPATPNCPQAVNASGSPVGITCPALGHGFGAYLQWDAIKGVHCLRSSRRSRVPRATCAILPTMRGR